MDVHGFYTSFVESLKIAVGSGYTLYLVPLAALYLFIAIPRMRPVVAALLIVALAVANPLSGGLALYVVEGSQPFSRFIWLLFPEILFSAAAADLCVRIGKFYLRIPVFAASVFLIIATGSPLTTEEFFTKPENGYQISQDAIEVGEYLLKKQEGENPEKNKYARRKAERSKHTRAIVAEELCYDIRQAYSGVHLYYGRHGIRIKNRIESRLIASSDEEATRRYFNRLHEDYVSAIVLKKDEGVENVMEHFGWVPEGEAAGYTVYVEKEGD